MPLILLRGSIDLATRLNTPIENYFDRRELTDGERMEAEAYRRRYPNATPRPAGLSCAYNCHGLTFAARRTGISLPSEVSKIISEDEYAEVAMRDVLPGDIVLYYRDGDIEHSGVVIEKLKFGAKILSKWGTGEEFVHMVGDCPYDGSTARYWRIVR